MVSTQLRLSARRGQMNDAAAAAVDAAERQVVVAAPKEKTEAEKEKEKWEQEVVTDKIMLMFAFQVGGAAGVVVVGGGRRLAGRVAGCWGVRVLPAASRARSSKVPLGAQDTCMFAGGLCCLAGPQPLPPRPRRPAADLLRHHHPGLPRDVAGEPRAGAPGAAHAVGGVQRVPRLHLLHLPLCQRPHARDRLLLGALPLERLRAGRHGVPVVCRHARRRQAGGLGRRRARGARGRGGLQRLGGSSCSVGRWQGDGGD